MNFCNGFGYIVLYFNDFIMFWLYLCGVLVARLVWCVLVNGQVVTKTEEEETRRGGERVAVTQGVGDVIFAEVWKWRVQ